MNTKKALSELGIEATVEKVENMEDIMGCGVMQTPALMVDEQVKVMGRIPSVKDKKILAVIILPLQGRPVAFCNGLFLR